MAACDPYTYPSNCPYPNYGYSSTPTKAASVPVQHVSFFHHYFGTSPLEIAASIALLVALVYAVYRFLVQPIIAVVHSVLNFWKLKDQKAVFLEVTPPAHIEKSPEATKQLLSTMQEVIDPGDVISLEIVASPSEGIRYLMRVRETDVEVLQRHVASHVHDARFRMMPDSYKPEYEGAGRYRLLELGQSRHYAYPLQKQEDYAEHDPVAYITGAMTKLEQGEVIVMQMVAAPHFSRKTSRLRNKLMSGNDVTLDHRVQAFLITRWWVWAASAVFGLLTHSVRTGLSWMLVGLIAALFVPKQEVQRSPAQQKVIDQMLDKLAQPLFKTDIRILVVANDNQRINSLAKSVHSSLASLNVPGYQQLQTKRAYPFSFMHKFSMYKLDNRLPSLLPMNSSVFASSELADIYHFPYGDIDTEDLVKSRSRTLPAPLTIKNGAFDVMLGRNYHHGTVTDVGLAANERERHMYVIGGTGAGKTTMLQYAIVQDIMNGKGVAVVDPHGDLAEKILRYIPENRLNDVIYFDPADISYPIGLNLIELPEDISGDELLLAQDFVTEAVVSVFRKIFSEDDSGGHRIEHVLRNAVHTAFTVEDANLFTVRKLLNNPDFRKKVVAKLEDEDIKDFWINEFGLAGNYQKYKAMDGVIAKIGRFQRSVVTRRILEQVKSTVDFDDVLDGKILICNLAKGSIGEDTSAVLGTAILTRLQLAAYRRIQVAEKKRRPFYVYVDEFQNFVSPLFIQMLSESRKYKLFLTMAEQSTSQQDRQLTENILDNAGTVVCFRTGNPADEELMLHQFKGSVKEGEIMHLPIYNFYMRTASENSQETFSGKTVLLEDVGSESIAKKAKTLSRKNYTIKYKPSEPAAASNKKEAKTNQSNSGRATDFPENN